MKSHLTLPGAVHFGLVHYAHALDLQQRLHAEVAAGDRPDTLILLEHPHVYTLGRRGSTDDILASETELKRLGIEVHHTDRGGEVTYHGPGQLVGYPIINLRRWGGGPLKYVRSLEATIIAALSEFDIQSQSEGHPTGVWVEDRKIAAIGVKVARRVTTHGFAINVSADLSYFRPHSAVRYAGDTGHVGEPRATPSGFSGRNPACRGREVRRDLRTTHV